MTGTVGLSSASASPRQRLSIRSEAHLLRLLAVGAGIGSAVLFIAVGLHYDLQMFGDGSIFSYSVAVADGWRIHWHNISCRLFVHIFCHLPAEVYVKLTADARGGIMIYGFLFFGAQLFGLLVTRLCDRSKDGVFFAFACASTAGLCPLVFGFPTEMWIAHAVFWPALAVAHYASGRFAWASVFLALLALIFTHEGALIFAGILLATVLLRGSGDPAFFRAASAGAAALAIWIAIRLEFPPDNYISEVLARAAFNFIDVSNLALDPFRLLIVALAGYAATALVLRRINVERAHFYAALAVAGVLTAHVLWSNAPIEGENRYFLRTALLIFTPVLGAVAAVQALAAENALHLRLPGLSWSLRVLGSSVAVRLAAGAIVVAMSVHAVETKRFVAAWVNYESAVRKLATGTVSDPALGDARFVSANRIPPSLDGLVWASTTHFLSILVAPSFSPARLVVDPDANYYWLSCKMASAKAAARRAMPLAARQLVRKYACLHRRR